MFTEDSKLVQDYVLLIQVGKRTLEEVPEFQNLRDVVKSVIAN